MDKVVGMITDQAKTMQIVQKSVDSLGKTVESIGMGMIDMRHLLDCHMRLTELKNSQLSLCTKLLEIECDSRGSKGQDPHYEAKIDQITSCMREIEEEMDDLKNSGLVALPQTSNIPAPHLISAPVAKTLAPAAASQSSQSSQSQTSSPITATLKRPSKPIKRTRKAADTKDDVVSNSQDHEDKHPSNRRHLTGNNKDGMDKDDVSFLALPSCTPSLNAVRNTAAITYDHIGADAPRDHLASFEKQNLYNVSCLPCKPRCIKKRIPSTMLTFLLGLILITKMLTLASTSSVFTTYSLNANGLCNSLKMNHIRASITSLKPTVFVLNKSKTDIRISSKLPCDEYEIMEEPAVQCTHRHLYKWGCVLRICKDIQIIQKVQIDNSVLKGRVLAADLALTSMDGSTFSHCVFAVYAPWDPGAETATGFGWNF